MELVAVGKYLVQVKVSNENMSELVSVVIEDEVIFSKLFPLFDYGDIARLLETAPVVKEALCEHGGKAWKFDDKFRASLASSRPAGQPPVNLPQLISLK